MPSVNIKLLIKYEKADPAICYRDNIPGGL